MTKLAEFIGRTGGTQAEFADAHGLPRPMVCQAANGTRLPGLEFALKLQAATRGEVPASYWADLKAARRADGSSRVGKRQRQAKRREHRAAGAR